MTTTASKHGLRKAAGERRNRHAQRTMLPPRAGEVEEAREPVRASKPDLSASKSWPKAEAVMGVLLANEWDCHPEVMEGDRVELLAKRGPETLWISWSAGVLTTEPMPSYTVGDRTIKLRNASAVKQYATRAPEEGQGELERVASNTFFKKKAIEPKRSKLPFDPASATEIEITEALLGKAISWHNRLRSTPETAVVGKNRKRIHFTEFEGERIFNFLCPATGFRGVRLSALTRVGGKVTKISRTELGLKDE